MFRWMDEIDMIYGGESRKAGVPVTFTLQQMYGDVLAPVDVAPGKLMFVSCIIKMDNRRKHNSHDWCVHSVCPPALPPPSPFLLLDWNFTCVLAGSSVVFPSSTCPHTSTSQTWGQPPTRSAWPASSSTWKETSTVVLSPGSRESRSSPPRLLFRSPTPLIAKGLGNCFRTRWRPLSLGLCRISRFSIQAPLVFPGAGGSCPGCPDRQPNPFAPQKLKPGATLLNHLTREVQAYELGPGNGAAKASQALVGYVAILPGPCQLLRTSDALEPTFLDSFFDFINRDAVRPRPSPPCGAHRLQHCSYSRWLGNAFILAVKGSGHPDQPPVSLVAGMPPVPWQFYLAAYP